MTTPPDLARIATLQRDEERSSWRLIYHPGANEIVECDSLAELMFWLHARARELEEEDS